MGELAEVNKAPGKAARDENFPVGSRLLPARLRPHVATFYTYARAIDDIADNPTLEPAEKIARLDDFAKAVSGINTTRSDFAQSARYSPQLGCDTGDTSALHERDMRIQAGCDQAAL